MKNNNNVFAGKEILQKLRLRAYIIAATALYTQSMCLLHTAHTCTCTM